MDLRILESVIGQLFRQMAHCMMNIETSKRILTERPNFNPTQAFRELTLGNFLTPITAMNFCERYGILCSLEDVQDVLAYWDIN